MQSLAPLGRARDTGMVPKAHLYWVTMQSEALLAPTVRVVPWSQGMQSPTLVLPSKGRYFPLGQKLQELDPLLLE
jgi:hypothetical protein